MSVRSPHQTVRFEPRILTFILVIVSLLASLVVAADASPEPSDLVTAPLGPDIINTLNDVDNPVRMVSIALDSQGLPSVAYFDRNDRTMFVRCLDVDCASTASPRRVSKQVKAIRPEEIRMARNDGPVLALDRDDRPVIAYFENPFDEPELTVVRCTNNGCRGTQAPVSVTPRSGQDSLAMVLDRDGYPVVAYLSEDGPTVVHCSNADCSGNPTSHSPVADEPFATGISIVLAENGNPIVAFSDGIDIKLLLCRNQSCSGPHSSSSPAAVEGLRYGRMGRPSLTLDSQGYPVIGYASAGMMMVLHCSNPDCSGDQTAQTVDTSDDRLVRSILSLSVDSQDYPVLAYQAHSGREEVVLRISDSDLAVLHCSNADCSGAQSPSYPDTAGNTGMSPSMVLDGSGNPVVAYNADPRSLKVLHCYDTGGCGGQDQDQDGVAHSEDNCRAVFNPEQTDWDQDGKGNECDAAPGVDPLDVVPDPVSIPVECGAGFEDANIIVGTDANERLVGTNGSDVIIGVGGRNRIIGKGGRDCLVGGDGRDKISGGGGDDVIFGHGGRDRLKGGRGDDFIDGGSGNDKVIGKKGRDTCTGATPRRTKSCEVII